MSADEFNLLVGYQQWKKKNQLKTNPTEKYASITFKAIFSKTIFSQFPL